MDISLLSVLMAEVFFVYVERVHPHSQFWKKSLAALKTRDVFEELLPFRMYFRGCCFAFVGRAGSVLSPEWERRLLGWLLSGLLQAAHWAGRFAQGTGTGVKQKPCSACVCPARSTRCSAASRQLSWATPLTDVSVASDCSPETDAFKAQETKNIQKRSSPPFFPPPFLPFPSFFFSLEAEKWSTFDKMLLDGNTNASYGTSFWRDESFPNVFGSQS